jgi:hypothetical protein
MQAMASLAAPVALGSMLAAGALLLASGCSSSGASPASDAGVLPGSDSGEAESGADGGIDSGTESGALSGDAGAPSSVVIQQDLTPTLTLGSVAIRLDPHYPGGLGCARTISGPCTIDDCSATDAPDAGELITESAGALTLSGGSLASPLKLSFGANGYTSPFFGSALFEAGDVFTVSAPGAAFPAFSGQSAPAPGTVTVTSPTPTTGPSGPTYPFDPTAAMTWTWTGGTTGDSVSFTVATADLILTCTFDATAGTGTIPQDVVARFPATEDSIEISAVSSTTLAAGGQSLLFEVASSGPSAYIASQ